MRVAGVGCRAGTSAEDVTAAIIAALDRCGLVVGDLDAVATAAAKANEIGITAAAAGLSLPLVYISTERLRAVADRAATRSARVVALRRVPSVAETAALAAAGRASRLLAPRVTTPAAACAIAEGAAE
jgi:cobalt-precorrin 5A hydrolase